MKDNWIVNLLFDFFFGLGVSVTLWFIFVVAALDGRVENGNIIFVVAPPMIYSFLMGNLYRWPKELNDRKNPRHF